MFRNSTRTTMPGALIALALLLFQFTPAPAHAAVFTITLNYNAFTANDGLFSITVDGVSNGVPFLIDNPASGTIFELGALNDFITVTSSGQAFSHPSEAPDFPGRSNASLATSIRYGQDWDNGASQPLAPSGGGFTTWFGAASMAWEIDANGVDAYANANQSIQQNAVILASNSALSDTLFGDNLNGVDLGSFGAPMSGTTGYSWLSDTLPEAGTAGTGFAILNAFNDAQAFSSSATFTTTMSFGIYAAEVPLPAAAWLLMSGLVGLIGIAKRR